MTKRTAASAIIACALVVALVATIGYIVTRDRNTTANVSTQDAAEVNLEVSTDGTPTSDESQAELVYVHVPNVTADTSAEAVSRLEQEGFSVVVVNDYSGYFTFDHVCAQTPTGNAANGSCITITVSIGSNPYSKESAELQNVPEVRGYSVQEAISDLDRHNLTSDIEGPDDGIVIDFERVPLGTDGPGPAVRLHTVAASGGTYDSIEVELSTRSNERPSVRNSTSIT